MSAQVPSEPFIAVIGDLVASRQIEDRAEAQEDLVTALERLNENYSEFVASRFLVTLGDEFQGLLRYDAPVDEIWWWYQRSMPYETRFGFGFGRLASPLLEEALGMDGPCWNAARSAIERAEDGSIRLAVQVAGSASRSRDLNQLLALVDRTIDRWTPTQRETVLLLVEHGSQLEVAEARGVSSQAVSKALEASHGLEIVAALRSVMGLCRLTEDG